MTARSIPKIILLATTLSLLPFAATAEDAPVVSNAVSDDLPRETRILTESWSIGSDDEDIVLGMVTRVRGNETGSVYLLDTRQHVVHILAADGEHLGSVGREGDGPGEVREPRDLLLLPDDSFGLLQRMPGKIVKIDRAGIPVGTVTIAGDAEGGFTSIQQIDQGGPHTVVLGRYSRPGEGQVVWEYFLAPVSTDGLLGANYASGEARLGGSNLVFQEKDHYLRMFMPWTIGTDNAVYYAPDSESYQIHVRAADGTLKHIVERDFEPVRRSGAMLGALNAAFESCIRGSGADVEFVIEKTAPAIVDVHVDENGALWVRHSRSLASTPDGMALIYDVYGADGRLQKQVTLVGHGVGEFDRLYLLPGDRAVMVRDHLINRLVIDCQGSGSAFEDEAGATDLPVVACYVIE